MRSTLYWFAWLTACAEVTDEGTRPVHYSAADGSEVHDLDDCTPEIGTGKLSQAIPGPAPRVSKNFVSGPFRLVKNWDFGEQGNVRDMAMLNAEFQYHDQFGTIANGTNYGAVSVATSPETAISAWNLGLPSDEQPIDDPERPFRELTAQTLKTYVRPLDPDQASVSARAHDAGSGSMMAKWHLPEAGAPLGRDILWETRARITTPVQGYWFALWTAGSVWDGGPEIDVVESFGAPHVPHDSFHATAVGGTNQNDFASWPNALDRAGVPSDERDLREFHTWTMLYLRDDKYRVYFDDHLVQQGVIHWRLGGMPEAEPTGMHFLFDLGWGHTLVRDVDLALWASQFPLEYEIDYSRVYLR